MAAVFINVGREEIEDSLESEQRPSERSISVSVVLCITDGAACCTAKAPCFAAVVAAAVAARNAQQGGEDFLTPREKAADLQEESAVAMPDLNKHLDFHTPRECTPVATPRGAASTPAPRSATNSASPSVSRAASPEWTQRVLAEEQVVFGCLILA